MKTCRFTEEQIIGLLRQAEAGMPDKDVCRSGGFSDATFYKWSARLVLERRVQLSQLDVARLARESGLVSTRSEYMESIWHVPN